MTEPDVLDQEALETALWSLLDAYPTAGITGVENNGYFCDLPDSIPATDHRRVVGRGGIDLVAPQYMKKVLAQFKQAKQTGASILHVGTPEGEDATIYLLDLRERHGVIVLIFVDGHTPNVGPVELPAYEHMPSRFGRFWRTELAEVVDVDKPACQLTGFSRDELIGGDPLGLIHPEDHEAAIACWMDMVLAPDNIGMRWKGRHKRKDGSWVWIEFTNYSRLNDPEHGDVVTELIDISEEMAANEAVREGRELLRRLTEALPLGVLQIDFDRNVVYTNDRLHEIVGVPLASTLDDQLQTVVAEDRFALAQAVETVLSEGEDVDVELRVLFPQGYFQRICQVTLRALRNQAGETTGAIICVSDVTDSTLMRKELETRATFDLLTHCYNRASIMAELERTLERSAQPDMGTAVVFVDLDEFKPINDRWGHAAGDEVLVAVADRLRSAVRANDLVGRLGGDEFLVLCPDVGQPEMAVAVGERIAKSMEPSLTVCGAAIEIKAGIGVGWSVNHDTTADALVALADNAMYESKRKRVGPVLAMSSETPAQNDVGDDLGVR